jgi:(E)-4-hydroxy-3-methylbut-2-enyl-diphosphate synthase
MDAMSQPDSNVFTLPYARSRYVALRRKTREVSIGGIKIGGRNPIAVQSMTNTPTQDVQATVRQAIALAEAGCEIVRITAPNLAAAQALKDIRRELTAAGFGRIPLVADIHFLPAAAMEAALHVEKVRINPGNYADRKLAAPKDYTDAEYAAELERLHEAVKPLILRCKELGRAIRIGVNHGSLSDRIVNRYGDTPLGMSESAMEFLRICEDLDFHDIVVSLKASNPRVMLEATRLVAARMDAAGMPYPLHLGVTEAGGGEDARVKSAIGIGTMLRDGLGDTIRVSLTESPVAEVPVAIALAREAEALWAKTEADPHASKILAGDSVRPYEFTRRESVEVTLGKVRIGGKNPPAVAAVPGAVPSELAERAAKSPAPVEALVVPLRSRNDAGAVLNTVIKAEAAGTFVFGEIAPDNKTTAAEILAALPAELRGRAFAPIVKPGDETALRAALVQTQLLGTALALDMPPALVAKCVRTLKMADPAQLIFTTTRPEPPVHPAGRYRMLAETLAQAEIASPVWIRHTRADLESAAVEKSGETAVLMDAAVLVGGLLADGIGDLASAECDADTFSSADHAYSILQGARARTTRTEYIACPSCGRTLYDIESTVERVKKATGHLKGVTIAVMGCIVNGPGEMADADFGYVGGAPGKINLYVGKTPVKFNIPSENAVDELVALIKQHGRWQGATQGATAP